MARYIALSKGTERMEKNGGLAREIQYPTLDSIKPTEEQKKKESIDSTRKNSSILIFLSNKVLSLDQQKPMNIPIVNRIQDSCFLAAQESLQKQMERVISFISM